MTSRKATTSLLYLLPVLFMTSAARQAFGQGETADDIINRDLYLQTLRAGGQGRTIPPGAYEQAVAQNLTIPQDRSITNSPTSGTSWASVNPSGLWYARTNANYISGRTNYFAFHPTDPNTFYIAAAGGGVWKTTNGGGTFQALTDNLSSLACGSVAVDPTNPNVVYLGTGELNYSGDSYYGNGLFKSTDAGATWTQIANTGTVGSYISEVAIDPTNTAILFVSANSGVFKSTNAGTSWANTGAGTYANCVLIDPSNDLNIYITTGGYFSGAVRKSTDGGSSWNTLGGGLPTSSVGRIQLAMAASNTRVLYASIASSSTYGLLGLYETTDGGSSWSLKNSSTNYLGGQGWYDNAIAVKPTDPTFVVGGGLDIYTSTNSGGTLTQRTSWFTTSASDFSHADIHFLGYHGTILYCGSDGGVYKSTDDGVTWSDMNVSVSTLQFQSGDYDATSIASLYGGTQDNNKETSTNGGVLWTQLTTGDGGYTVVDPVNTNYIYGQYVNGSVQRSTNFGSTYTEIRPNGGTGGLFYNPYRLAPGDHNTIVYGVSQLWKTSSAQTATSSSGWTQIAASGTVGGSVSAIGISATNTNKIYFGTSSGNILATTNNGSTWNTTAGSTYVTDLNVDPGNDSICYASFSGFGGTHVKKTTDGGGSWSNITGTLPNIPVLCIQLRTTAPRTIFLGTDLGVYTSTDEGASWVSFNNGMPLVAVFDLKYKESTQLLMAATHGRGCWTFNYALFLPIELRSLTAAVAVNDMVRLEWTTETEIDNYGFEVQKSPASQMSYTTIPNSFVPGHGTSLVPERYVFSDPGSSAGDWFYRLKQMDLNGKVHYSEAVQVRVAGGVIPARFALYQNFPNPFNPSTTIRFDLPGDADVTLRVYNVLGELVADLVNGHRPAGSYEAQWNATGMASGMYYYRLAAGNDVTTNRLLLLK